MRAVPRKSVTQLRALLPKDDWHSGGTQNPKLPDNNPGSGDTLQVHSGLDTVYADVHHRSSGHDENTKLRNAIRDAFLLKPTHDNFVLAWRMYPREGAQVPEGGCGCGCSCT